MISPLFPCALCWGALTVEAGPQAFGDVGLGDTVLSPEVISWMTTRHPDTARPSTWATVIRTTE